MLNIVPMWIEACLSKKKSRKYNFMDVLRFFYENIDIYGLQMIFFFFWTRLEQFIWEQIQGTG